MANDVIGQTVDTIMSGAFLNSAGFAKFLFFGKIIVSVAIFLFGAILIWKYWLQYKIKVEVFKMSGGSVVDVIEDRAKMVQMDTQGKRKIVLFKLRKSCPPPLTKYKYKSGKLDKYILYQDDNGELHPCEIGAVDPQKKMYIDPQPEDRKGWGKLERSLAEEKIKKQGWFDKHKEAIIMITACTCAFLIMFFATKVITTEMSELVKQFGQVATNCGKFG